MHTYIIISTLHIFFSLYKILSYANYTICFSINILHHIDGGNKLIKGLLYATGDRKKVTSTGPSKIKGTLKP